MKYIRQSLIIIAISFCGEILHYFIPLPIPASIYGIIILFLLLSLKIIPLEAVKTTGKFLVEILPIMFIPASVALMDSWGIVKDQLLKYIVVTVVSTVVVMVVTGWITQFLVKRGVNKNE